MNIITPFFEINGKTYAIKRTRYLIAEYDKIAETSNLTNEDKQNAIKAQTLIADVQKYGAKADEFWKKLEENPTKEARDNYFMFKDMYNNTLEELTKLEAETGSTSKLQKQAIDALERIAIKGLAEQYFDFDENKAKSVWESNAEKLGNNATVEWLMAMSDCLFKEEEEVIEENSFLSQMRKRAEEKATLRKNIIKKR